MMAWKHSGWRLGMAFDYGIRVELANYLQFSNLLHDLYMQLMSVCY